MKLRPVRAVLGPLALVLLAITGCSNNVTLDPAEMANDPSCADVTVRLPDEIAGVTRRWTDAQATGAWGSPVAVILTCGLKPSGPSDRPCVTFGGVDWLVADQANKVQEFLSFGRTPAVEVVVARDAGIDFAAALEALGPAVASLPKDGECTPTS